MKDRVTKTYMEQNHIFADAFNYYIFGGQQKIRPEQLSPLDITEISIPYGANGAESPEQRYRDIMKSLAVMEDETAVYLLLGIENQSEVHFAIPVKNLLYDALNYAKQVQKAASSHRKKKDHRGHRVGEFLSGFHKEDRLLPVITLVVFFSPEEWDGSLSLHEMLSVQDERILALIPDYQVHLIAPYQLSNEELEKFHSTLREVLLFIKHSQDKKDLDSVIHGDFHRLRKEEIDVLNYCVNVKLELEQGEEELDLCKAWEDMKREATDRATENTLLQNIQNVMEAFHVSAEQAMTALKVPEKDRPKFFSML